MAKFLDKAGLEHFWASLKTLFNSKVDKVSGKGLSTNDFSDEASEALAEVHGKAHTHSNKTVLDGITSAKIAQWNSASAPTYGGIDVSVNTGCTLTIGTSKGVKMKLTSVNNNAIDTFTIRQTSSSGTLVSVISAGQLEPGLEIEVLNGYIFVNAPSGETLAVSQKLSTTTKLYFLLEGESSSDSLEFVYRIE